MLPSEDRNPSSPAMWWEPMTGERVTCTLCPRYCNIPNHSRGFCYIRINNNGRLYTTAYGQSTGFAADPIEKKPLYHFYPGAQVLSFGTLGCNLGCKFCQNWHISKMRGENQFKSTFKPCEIIEKAQRSGCVGIAYTYNDPIIFGEWVIDLARAAHDSGLKNVMVTNGFITPSARKDIFQHIDAANVDLKGFTETFYRKLTLSHLEPVLDTLRWLVNETKVWVEITNLIIPGENDDFKGLDELTRFVGRELKPEVPLHFSAFHPDFKLWNRPATPVKTLLKAKQIAVNNGLKYVYLGNVMTSNGQDTHCPQCGLALIQRQTYHVQKQCLDGNSCPRCGTYIHGCFEHNTKAA